MMYILFGYYDMFYTSKYLMWKLFIELCMGEKSWKKKKNNGKN